MTTDHERDTSIAEASPTRITTAPAGALPAGPDEWRAPAGTDSRLASARPDPRAVAEVRLGQREAANLITRRSMLRTSLWAGLGVSLAGSLLGFVNYFWPRKVTGFGGVVHLPASLVPAPGADPVKVFEAKAWVVNLKPGEGVPSAYQDYAPPSPTGGVLALYQKCPHLGCVVPWRPEFEFEGLMGWFRCPCHQSTYTKAGVRVYGPAPSPMHTFAVTPNPDGSLDIDTSRITKGGPDNALRAVQLG